jgi:hypothetical protein
VETLNRKNCATYVGKSVADFGDEQKDDKKHQTAADSSAALLYFVLLTYQR